MPGNSLGYSFAPTFENAQQVRGGGAAGAQPQGAIQTLNFRLPSVTGAASSRALSPLVGDQQRGSSFGSAVLESVLRTVLGSDAVAALYSGGGASTYSGSMNSAPYDPPVPTPTAPRPVGPVVIHPGEHGGNNQYVDSPPPDDSVRSTTSMEPDYSDVPDYNNAGGLRGEYTPPPAPSLPPLMFPGTPTEGGDMPAGSMPPFDGPYTGGMQQPRRRAFDGSMPDFGNGMPYGF